MNQETEGLVYYLLDANRLSQRIKIGYTNSLGARLNALAADTMMRQRPIVLALEEGGTKLERERHDQFRHLRTMGEWFEYGQDLDAHLRELPNPIGWITDRPDLWRYARGWRSFSGWAKRNSLEPDADVASPRRTRRAPSRSFDNTAERKHALLVVKVRPETLTTIDSFGMDRGLNRADAVRMLMAAGMDELDRQDTEER